MTEKIFTCHQMIADYSTGEDLDFDFLQELIDEQTQPKDLRMHISYGDKIITYRECVDLLNELSTDCRQLKEENEQLKSELQRIYDITTVNKVKNIVEEIYDDLLYETSEKSDYAREMVLKCLEKIEGFGDDLE